MNKSTLMNVFCILLFAINGYSQPAKGAGQNNVTVTPVLKELTAKEALLWDFKLYHIKSLSELDDSTAYCECFMQRFYPEQYKIAEDDEFKKRAMMNTGRNVINDSLRNMSFSNLYSMTLKWQLGEYSFDSLAFPFRHAGRIAYDEYYWTKSNFQLKYDVKYNSDVPLSEMQFRFFQIWGDYSKDDKNWCASWGNSNYHIVGKIDIGPFTNGSSINGLKIKPEIAEAFINRRKNVATGEVDRTVFLEITYHFDDIEPINGSGLPIKAVKVKVWEDEAKKKLLGAFLL